MKRWIGKETAPLPVSEQEAAHYIESAFLSRFFSESVSREEAHDWIATRFPDWPAEARRSAEQALSQPGAPQEAGPERLSWRKWWRHSRQGERSNGPPRPNSPTAFESPDQRLLLLARGYWYTGAEPYRRLLFEKANERFSTSRPWGNRPDASLTLWKGIWLLRFMSGSAAAEEVIQLWQAFLSHAAKESKKRDTPERGLFLLMMGTLFPETAEARSWKSRGMTMLERELFRKVGRDGVCRSKALSDQIGLLQIYLQAILIGRGHDPFPDRVEHRVERMLEFLSVQAQIPLLQRGRSRSVFSFNTVENRAIEKTLGLGAIVFNRMDWKGCGGCFSEEAFFLTGPAGYHFHQEEAAPSSGGSIVFEEAGYALLRSKMPDEKALIVRSASPGMNAKEGGVTFSMAAPGRLFLSDPSIRVEQEQSKGVLRTPFSKNGGPHSPWSRTFLGEEVDYVEGEQPVDRSAPSCKQRRSIFFIKPDYWIVHDTFLGEGIVNIDWLLPFVPQAKIEGNLAEGFHVAAPDGRLWLAALGTHLKGVDARVAPSEKQVAVRSAGPLPISLTTLLYPDRASSQSRYDFKSLYFPSIEGGSAFEVLTATHTDTFLFAPARKRLALSNVRFEGEQLFVRRDYVGEIARLFALSGRFCYWEGKILFESAQPVPFLELSYRGEILRVRGTLSGPISFYADGVEEVQVNGEKTYFTRDRDRLILHF